MARSHYSFQKRKREQKQKKKAEEKARRREARRASKQFDPLPIETARPVAPIPIDPQAIVPDSSFTVTDAAITHVAEFLEEARGEDGFDILFRVEQQPTGQLEIAAGQRLRNDNTFTQGPMPVLAIDRSLALGLDGRTLDVAPDSGGLKLVLR